MIVHTEEDGTIVVMVDGKTYIAPPGKNEWEKAWDEMVVRKREIESRSLANGEIQKLVIEEPL